MNQKDDSSPEGLSMGLLLHIIKGAESFKYIRLEGIGFGMEIEVIYKNNFGKINEFPRYLFKMIYIKYSDIRSDILELINHEERENLFVFKVEWLGKGLSENIERYFILERIEILKGTYTLKNIKIIGNYPGFDYFYSYSFPLHKELKGNPMEIALAAYPSNPVQLIKDEDFCMKQFPHNQYNKSSPLK